MNIVTITASGLAGCGKSAILGEIEIALKAIGIEVRWVGGDAETRTRPGAGPTESCDTISISRASPGRDP